MAEVTKKICKFYLEKKKRQCKFEVYKNSEFCCHHLKDEDAFVPCPIDPNHTVLKSHLEKHMQICPKIKYKKALEQSVWYKENFNIPKTENAPLELNLGAPAEEEEDEECKKKSKHFLKAMAENQPEQYKKLIEQIPLAFKKAIELYRESIMGQENISGIDIDTLCSEDYLLDTKGQIKVVDTTLSDTQKNAKQCDDLVQSLDRFGLVNKGVCFIEYGAGKGQLSHHISLTVKDCSNILIELEGRRHKLDKNHREDKEFYRIRADIKDFNINTIPLIFQQQREKQKQGEKTEGVEEEKQPEQKMEEVKEEASGSSRPLQVVGVSKHMCGLASDLTFYSLLNATGDPVNALGFQIGTCCHHRCTQELYMNSGFLDKIGLAPEMKKPFFHCSSWGIYRENVEKHPKGPKDQEKEGKDNDPLKLDSDLKTTLGLQVKRTLDIGRILCLRERGFNCYNVKYCEQVFSPENFVIAGRKVESK